MSQFVSFFSETPTPKVSEMELGNTGEEVQRLVWELAQISGHSFDRLFDERQFVISCLKTCFYVNGGGEKPVPISKDDLDSVDPLDAYLLRRKIGKIEDDEVFRLCRELADLHPPLILEQHTGASLYVFLAKRVVTKKTKPKQKRWIR